MIFLILSSIAYADVCEVERTKEILRKNLYLHLTSSLSPLTLSEVKDLLTFYISINPSLIIVDCSASGSSSGRVISNIVGSGESAADIIPICPEGTKYGKCSGSKPKYCYGGSIIDKCLSCGCPNGTSCNARGKCDPASSIACFSSVDCGNSQFTGNYYCGADYITKNYLNYTCLNPGTTNSNCISSTYPLQLSYCNSALNQTCVAGSASCQAFLDAILPNASITSPAAGSNVSGMITITAAASDNIGIAGVQFKLDGSSLGAEDTSYPYSALWNTTSASNGLHSLAATTRDTSGNTAASAAINVFVSNAADSTPPVMSSGKPNGTLAAGTAQTNISLATSEASTCRYSTAAGTAYASMNFTFSTTGGISHSKIVTGLANGTNYNYYTRCQDAAGNVNTLDYIISFSVAGAVADLIPPQVSINSPISGAKVNGTIAISASASDNVGVVGVQFKLDGSNLGFEDTSFPYSASWNTATASNGIHNLTAAARDAVGNTNTSARIIVNASNIANQNPVALISASSINGTAPIIIKFNGTQSYDPDGFISSYNWSFGDGAQSTISSVQHDYSVAGFYNTTLRVTDNNGAIGVASKVIILS